MLNGLGPQIQWLRGRVSADKVYCLYIAPGEAPLREHARLDGFPAGHTAERATGFNPNSAE